MIFEKDQFVTSKGNQETDNTRLAIRNSAFSLLSLVARFVGNTAIFVVIARLPGIDVSDFGQLTYAVALASLFIMFSQFGLLPLLVRDVAANRSLLTKLTPSIFSLRIALSLVGLSLMFTYVHLTDMDNQALLVCLIMAIALYVGSFSTDIQALFQSQERMHLEMLGTIFENGILLTIAILAFFYHPDIIQISYIFLIVKSVTFIVNYVICGRTIIWIIPKVDFAHWLKLISKATPFAVMAVVAAGIVLLDTVLLRELAPGDADSAVGIYQAAVRLFLIPMLLPAIVLKVFLPQFSRMHGQRGSGLVRDLGRVNHILLTLGLLIGLVTVFRGSDLILLLYGEKYANAGPLLQVFGVVIIMRFGAAYNLYFTIRDRLWFRMLSAILALVSIVLFDYLLIPKYGVMGAAYASIIAHSIFWTCYLVALYLAERTLALGWRFFRAISAGIVLAIILYFTSEIHILFMLPLYAALCLLGAYATMHYEDRNRIRSHVLIA